MRGSFPLWHQSYGSPSPEWSFGLFLKEKPCKPVLFRMAFNIISFYPVQLLLFFIWHTALWFTAALLVFIDAALFSWHCFVFWFHLLIVFFIGPCKPPWYNCITKEQCIIYVFQFFTHAEKKGIVTHVKLVRVFSSEFLVGETITI